MLFEIGITIIVSSLAAELFKNLKLPGLIGAILVGLFIGGPGGLSLVTDLTVINVLALIGSVLILFIAGLEFEVSAFWRTGKSAFFITTVGVIVSLIIGYAFGQLIGLSREISFLLGAAIAPSGTSVIAFALSSFGKTESQGGLTLLTACIIDDIEGVILLAVALALVGTTILSPLTVTYTVGIAIVFVLGSIYIGGKLFPLFLIKLERILSDEMLLALMLGSGLILAFLATRVGLAAITGAFIMGAVIPYRKFGEKIAHRLLPMKEIFAAIFFTSIGLSINPFDLPPIVLIAIGALLLALFARLIGGLAGGFLGGIKGKQLIVMSLGLAVRGEMSLIIAQQALLEGIANSQFLAIVASVVIGSILLTIPLFYKVIREL